MRDAATSGKATTDKAKQSRKKLAALLRFIGARATTMTLVPEGAWLQGADDRRHLASIDLIDEALATGLVTIAQATPPPSAAAHGAPSIAGPNAPPDSATRRLALLPAARSFLRRLASENEERFLAQHADVVSAVAEVDGVRQKVRLDQSESPLSSLARLKDRTGAPFMPAEAMAAGERLAADFTRGQLQPRVTASWEPKLSSSAAGTRGGMADLCDSAMAARLAVNRAAAAMGPELSGVALDICCFMKGLATVERERQWPARSAKLMLRTALLALSRHYSPPPKTRPASRHWGTDDYRPDWL